MVKFRKVKESSIKKIPGGNSYSYVVGIGEPKTDEEIYEKIYSEMAALIAAKLVEFFKFEIRRPRPGRIEWDSTIEIIVPETPKSMKAQAATAKTARAKAAKRKPDPSRLS
jgi:hypothetical protein